MNKKLLALATLFFLVIGVFVSVFTVTSRAMPQRECIVGAWVGSFDQDEFLNPDATFEGGGGPSLVFVQHTINPQDNGGVNFTYVIDLGHQDHSFGIKELAEANYMSPLVGQAMQTGDKTYDVSLIGYGIKNREKYSYLWTVTGSMECGDGNKMTNKLYFAVYTPDQDADKNGFPDKGTVPISRIGPVDFESQRVPYMPPPPPPPKDE